MKKQMKRFLALFLTVNLAVGGGGVLPTRVLAAESSMEYTPKKDVKVTETVSKDDDTIPVLVEWKTTDPLGSWANQDNIENSYIELEFNNNGISFNSGEWLKQEVNNNIGKLYFKEQQLKDEWVGYAYLKIKAGTYIKQIRLHSEVGKQREYRGELSFYRGAGQKEPIGLTYTIGNKITTDIIKVGGNLFWATDLTSADLGSMNYVGIKSATVSVSKDNLSLPTGQTVSIPISVSALTALGTDAAYAYTGKADTANGIDKDVYAKVSNIKYTGTDYGNSVSFSDTDGKLYLNINESIYDKIGNATSIELPLTATVKQTLTNNTVTGSKTITLARPKVECTSELSKMTCDWEIDDNYYKMATNATLTASGNYELPDSITVQAGDNVLTADEDYTYSKADGSVEINAAAVTGNIKISATADEKATPIYNINEVLEDFDKDKWYNNNDSTLTTAEGWTVSTDRNGTFSKSIELDGEGEPVTKMLYFKKEETGNKVYSYELKYNRDVTAPTISEINGIPDEEVFENPKITFKPSDDTSGVNLNSVTVTCEDGEDVTYDANSFIANRNGKYTIKVTDNAGNETTKEVTISNIHVHSYKYAVNEENSEQIIESCTCGHKQTATLEYSQGDGRYTYTGSAITPVKVVYSEGWIGDKTTEISYLNNTNAGEVKGLLTIEGVTADKSFTIVPYDISGKVTVTINPGSGKYTGLPYNPKITINVEGKTLVEGVDYKIDWDKDTLLNVGEYTVTITGKGNFKGEIKTNFEIENGWNPVTGEEYTLSESNDEGWVRDDFVITAKDGYQLSLTNTAGGPWTDTLNGSVESDNSTVEFYVKNTADGTISEMVTVNYKLDKVAPNGKVSFDERTGWEDLVNTITFGLFYKDEVTVKAEAGDALSGVATVEFIEAAKAMTAEELKNSDTNWETLPAEGKKVTFKDAKQFIYYIRITDKAGNMTYISTDGAEYDNTVPVISGIEDGKTYYTTQKVSVTDKNIYSILVNDEEATKDIILDGNVDKEYEIVATDKAGNSKTVNVKMKPIASISTTIDSITEDSVKASDKEAINDVIEQVDELLKDTDLTNEEKTALEKIKDNADKLINKIEATYGTIKALTDKVATFDKDTVTSEDKQVVQDLIDGVKELLDGKNITDSERETLEQIKNDAEAIMKKIEAANEAITTENIENVKDINSENVKPEDKTALEDAKADLKEALKEHGDNMTEAEKQAIQDEINRIEEALDVIEKIETVKELINNLPDADKVNLSDKKAIYAAKEAYDKLSDYEKSLIDASKLDKAVKAFERVSEAANTPSTGDDMTVSLWLVLMISAVFGVAKINIYNNKKLR